MLLRQHLDILWDDKNDKEQITIGDLLKKIRTQRNITIDEYAKEIGINPEVLSKYESGAKMGYNTYKKDGVEFAPPKLVCNNQVHCKSGSAKFEDVLEYVCNSLRECIEDFELRIEHQENDSTKLHKKLVENLERKYKELEEKELAQWDAQYNPDLKMPTHIFQKLNEKLLKEKDKVRLALCEARDSIPVQVDYQEKIYKFTDVLNILEDKNASAVKKNNYLKDIIERIDYERPPIVRITKENAKQYGETVEKGMKYHIEPFIIKIKLKAPL